MQRSKLILASLIFLGLMFTGFDCSSSSLTGARLYIQNKNFDKAYEVLQKEVATNPKSDEGFYLLGYVYGERDQYDSMMVAFNKSLAISNKFEKDIKDQKLYYWGSSFNKGVAFFQKGNNSTNADSIKLYYNKSIDQFKLATIIEPDSAATFKNLAFVYMNAGEYDNAIEPLQKIIDMEQSRDGYRFLGQIYYEKAVKYKNEYAATNNTSDSVAYMENYGKAIKVLEKGRELYPNDSDILVTLSNSYIGSHQIKIAMDAFKAGVEQDPNNKYYHYNYGVLLLGDKQFQAAIDQFEQATQIDPNYLNAVYNLGVAYLKWGDFLNDQADEKGMTSDKYKSKIEAAVPYLEKAVSIDANQADMWETLGKVYSIIGKQAEAKAAFDKSDELRK